MGPDPGKLREIARSVEEIMRNDPNMRTVNVDWGERVPKLHFVLDQERLQLIGLSPEAAAQQSQFLLNGQTITQVREDIRAVNIVARSAGPERLDPTKLENFTLTTRNGKPIPISQIGRVEIQVEFVPDQ
jgi:multidrug efflux pump subunit AcrB